MGRYTESGALEWERPCRMCGTEGYWPLERYFGYFCPDCRVKFDAQRAQDDLDEADFSAYTHEHKLTFLSYDSRDRFKARWLGYRAKREARQAIRRAPKVEHRLCWDCCQRPVSPASEIYCKECQERLDSDWRI